MNRLKDPYFDGKTIIGMVISAIIGVLVGVLTFTPDFPTVPGTDGVILPSGFDCICSTFPSP